MSQFCLPHLIKTTNSSQWVKFANFSWVNIDTGPGFVAGWFILSFRKARPITPALTCSLISKRRCHWEQGIWNHTFPQWFFHFNLPPFPSIRLCSLSSLQEIKSCCLFSLQKNCWKNSRCVLSESAGLYFFWDWWFRIVGNFEIGNED